jgi:hypothetical protein
MRGAQQKNGCLKSDSRFFYINIAKKLKME